jgi:hypothetical protein
MNGTMRRVLRSTTMIMMALGLPLGAHAQEWEELSTSRKVGDETSVDVRVRYGVGHVQLRAGEPGTLYRMNLRYDREHFDPVVEYRSGRLELGVETVGRNLNIKGNRDGGELDLELAPDVAMDLVMELGAVRATVDLGGLELTDLELSTGASESIVDVSRPNRGRIRTAQFSVGAADFAVENLANLRADRIEVEAGVGEVTLGFGGEWDQDMRVSVSMGLGSLELRIPEGVGVRLEKDSFLTSLDAEGLVKDGNDHVSANWDTADRRLVIEVDAAFGSIQVVRIR